MIMKNVCFVSDLHIDYERTPIDWASVEADIVVIGGDVSNRPDLTIKTLNNIAALLPRVIFTDGNHEHYSNADRKVTVEENLAYIRARLADNIDMLGHGNPVVERHGINFIGVNGWYSCDSVGDPARNRAIWPNVDEGGINDCYNIGFKEIFQPMPWDRAKDDADLVRATIEGITNDLPIVVVTHTVPHRDMVVVDPADFQWNARNVFYLNMHFQKIIEDFGPRISIWYNGHTHMRKDKIINGVYCITNPRGNGIYDQNPGWSPVMIEV